MTRVFVLGNWSLHGFKLCYCYHIGGLVQERRNCIANAMEVRLPCFVSLCFDISQQDELSDEHTDDTDDL